MVLYGAEHKTPVYVNSMLMECLSRVILEAPIENIDNINIENVVPVVPIKVRVRLFCFNSSTGTQFNRKKCWVESWPNCKSNVQGISIRPFPGCENAAGKLRQKR